MFFLNIERSSENKENEEVSGGGRTVETDIGQREKRTPLKEKQKLIDQELEKLEQHKRDLREQVFGKSHLESSTKKYHVGKQHQEQDAQQQQQQKENNGQQEMTEEREA
jgi:hypothetical protein